MSIQEQKYHPESKLRAIGWQGQLERAERPEAVLSLARDYFAQISPDEVAQLPEECRPVRLVDAGDVADYAFELARHQAAGDGTEVLQKLATFFADASVRLSQLLAGSDHEAAR